MRNFPSPLIVCPLPSMTIWLTIAGSGSNSVMSLIQDNGIDSAPGRAATGGPVPVGGDDLISQSADQRRHGRRLGRNDAPRLNRADVTNRRLVRTRRAYLIGFQTELWIGVINRRTFGLAADNKPALRSSRPNADHRQACPRKSRLYSGCRHAPKRRRNLRRLPSLATMLLRR